jgi:RNA polymerase sigma factor (TIGR02999 family)
MMLDDCGEGPGSLFEVGVKYVCFMEGGPSSELVARLMAGFRSGDKRSTDQLMELLYPELRRMAAARLRREGPGHSWQPTLLVNELYLELLRNKSIGGESGGSEEERKAFLGLAGFLMKRLLILHSRPLRQRVAKVDSELLDEQAAGADTESLQTVEGLLDDLAGIDPKLRAVVEWRVFEGMTADEIAERMGCSPRSVTTYWSFARKWLATRLSGD